MYAQNGSDDQMSEENTDRDRLYARRELHMVALDQLVRDIRDDDVLQALSEGELRVRQTRMRKHFEEFEAAHVMYRQFCRLASDRVYTIMERKYMRAVVRIEDKLREQRSHSPSGFHSNMIDAHSSMIAGAPQIIRVETTRPPQVGKFNGSPSDWPAFRDLFLAEVEHKDFDPVTKLLYLQEACVDKAKDTLGAWQPTAGNYKAAWEIMVAAYDDEYHVIHDTIGKMFAVERQEKESHDALRTVLDVLNSGLRQLEANKPQAILWDQLWIHFGKQRLPSSTLDAWEQWRHHKSANRMPTLAEFKTFLDMKSKGRRQSEIGTNWSNQSSVVNKTKSEAGSTRSHPYDRNQTNSGARSSTQNKPEYTKSHSHARPTTCVVENCKQSHYLNQCDMFRALSYTERRHVLSKNRLCHCCLAPGHYASECTRPSCRSCPDTKFKHHMNMCPKPHQPSNSTTATAKRDATTA